MSGQTLRQIRESLPGPFALAKTFAVLVGRSQTMLSRYENDRSDVPPEVAAFAGLARALARQFPGDQVTAFLNVALDSARAAGGRVRR